MWYRREIVPDIGLYNPRIAVLPYTLAHIVLYLVNCHMGAAPFQTRITAVNERGLEQLLQGRMDRKLYYLISNARGINNPFLRLVNLESDVSGGLIGFVL
ncbi:hypothetical protein SDC9_130807 [bioreactor metagenome]|uniref:Uncharacterized protein n=1 Tax=bioreactor metagenome TaxID=1076179 RepID=A0A645D3V6_9ZZZZ